MIINIEEDAVNVCLSCGKHFPCTERTDEMRKNVYCPRCGKNRIAF